MSMTQTDLSDWVRIGDRIKIKPRGKRGIYVADFWHNGRHTHRSLKTSNLKIARQRAITLEAEVAGGEYAPRAKPIAIHAAATEYMDLKRVEGRKYKTLVKYQQWLDDFEEFCRTSGIGTVQQITAPLFEQFRARWNTKRSAKTLYTGLTIIKQLVGWCSGGGRNYLASNPLIGCKLSKPYTPPKYTPTPEQVNSILAAATGDRKRQFALLAFSGLRAQELQMLRPRDVDLAGGWIHVVGRPGWVPKTHEARKVPIHPRLREILAEVPATQRPYYFCASPSPKYPAGGHEINTKHLNEDFQKLAKGLRMTVGRKNDGLVIHSMRHFFETQAVDAGVPQFVVDAWMGHRGQALMGRVYYGLTDAKSQGYMKKVAF